MTLLDMLHRNALKYPDQIIWEDDIYGTCSFRDLDEISGRIFQYLKNRQIGTEAVVIIRLSRSYKIPIVILGVLKAGAAFSVIGENTPQDVVDFILQDVAPQLVFDESCYQEALKLPIKRGYVHTAPNALACIVYSSGSSGLFKGSMHEYGAFEKAVNRSVRYAEMNGLKIGTNSFRCVFASGFYAIGTLFGIIDSIVLGYYYYILPFEKMGNDEELAKILLSKRITDCIVSPRNVNNIQSIRSPYLIRLYISFDSFDASSVSNFTLINTYGMTESFCPLTYFEVDKSYDVTPIGKPSDIPMTILNSNRRSVSQNEIGEICFIPEYFRGYRNQPEKTAAALLDGWFHTGDMGYVNDEGNYVLIGRKIDLCKTKEGYIIPALISARFKKKFPEVIKSYVKIFTDVPNQPVICLYYCGPQEYDLNKIQNQLCQEIPDYMIPTNSIKLSDFSYFPSGKVNRNSFPRPESQYSLFDKLLKK